MARFGKLGWFLGLIFGAVFGVLFAPRKGKELRAHMKAERKKGKLGIAPLQDDLKHLGQELASLAMDVYESEPVQNIMIKGRKKVKQISGDLIGDVVQFEKTAIEPIKSNVSKGKRVLKSAKAQLRHFGKKAKASVRIGKMAFKEVKGVMKKK